MSPPGNPWDRGPAPRRSPRRLWLWLAVIAVAAGLVWLLAEAVGGQQRRLEDWSDVAYLLVLLGLVSSGVMVSRQFHLGTAARHAAIWAAVAGLLLVGYSYRSELRMVGNRVLGDLVPHQAMTTDSGAVQIRRGPDGHFRVLGLVNGVEVRFLVDTGASDIVLNRQDAERIGLRPDELAYTRIAYTANGQVRSAPVRLDSIAVGGIVLRDAGASVNGGELSVSLLGMSFLSRLSAFSVEGDTLTLRP